MAQHMRDDHAYEPGPLDSESDLWKLHAHFHGERLSTTQLQRALQGKHESDGDYAARLLREHGSHS